MSENSFDLIVIGTGPSAGTVAKKTAESGKSVAVIESRGYGGTCALRGCNPKKVYTNAADLVDRARRADGKLATFGDPQIDWAGLHAFKQQFTQPVLEKSEASFQKRGIKTFHGIARFTGPTAIEVDGAELHAKRIFIGTGARPVPLEFEGGEHVTHSDAFLELESMPAHVTFIGGGFISLEFSHVVSRYGSQVVVVDQHQRPLKQFDPDLVDQLVEWSRNLGIDFTTGATVSGIAKEAGGLSVHYDRGGDNQTIATQLAVHGAGRVPNLADLNLAAANVKHGQRGIEVDQFMRSVSNPQVFAAGDCVDSGQPRLTPVANEEARIIVKNLFASEPDQTPDYGPVPQVVFTAPPLAAVGLSESEARQQYADIDVRHEDISSWNSVRKAAQPCAAYKLLIDKRTDQILGAHLLGPAADETINLFALAMKFNLTARDIKSTLFAFPTFSSDVRQML